VIGQVYKGAPRFLPLVRALVSPNGSRQVLWTDTRNLPTRSAEAAACLMQATASQSDRVQRPAYWLSISFDPSDGACRDTITSVVNAVVSKLGVTEHQVLIVVHGEADNPHIHMVVNRVHPVGHRAWNPAWDWKRIEEALREQEVELGLRVVPGRLARVPGSPDPALRSLASLRHGDAAFLLRLQRTLGPILDDAHTWADVETSLQSAGLSFRICRGGLRFNDGNLEVKASEVKNGLSRRSLEKRFGKLTSNRIKPSTTSG
jgi:hypothetical protein